MKLEDNVEISDFAWFMTLCEGETCSNFRDLINLIKKLPAEMVSREWYDKTYMIVGEEQ